MALGIRTSKYRRVPNHGRSTIDGLPVLNTYGDLFYVDTVHGANSNTGATPSDAFLTVAKAFSAITKDYSTVYVTGTVQEQVATPAFKYCRVVGLSESPRGAVWKAPSSPTASTPLLQLKQRGWLVQGFLFNAPTDSSAVQIFRDATFNAQDSMIFDCEFNTGAIAIESNGGSPNALIKRNRIHDMTSGSVTVSGAIISTSTAQALPQRWVIADNYLANNANHIVMPLKIGLIGPGNLVTDVGDSITTTDKIKLSSGDHSFVFGNYLGGTYSIVGGYTPGTTDVWVGNLIAGGLTTANPA